MESRDVEIHPEIEKALPNTGETQYSLHALHSEKLGAPKTGKRSSSPTPKRILLQETPENGRSSQRSSESLQIAELLVSSASKVSLKDPKQQVRPKRRMGWQRQAMMQ